MVKTVWHQLRLRPRLMTALAVCATTALVAPRYLSGTTRSLVAWDVGSGLYLVLAWTMMLRRTTVENMRRRARLQDDGALGVLVLTVAASLASLAAIVLELAGVKARGETDQALHLILAALTILCSWGLVHTAFALHYAHEFYVDRRSDGRPALEFPGGGPPGYADFLYFAFVIGTTSQTSDVAIAAPSMRRLALLHGVIAFFFNTTLLALTVNIAAGLV